MFKHAFCLPAIALVALVGCSSDKSEQSSDKDHLLKAQQSALEKAKNVEDMALKTAEKQAKAIEGQSQ